MSSQTTTKTHNETIQYLVIQHLFLKTGCVPGIDLGTGDTARKKKNSPKEILIQVKQTDKVKTHQSPQHNSVSQNSKSRTIE